MAVELDERHGGSPPVVTEVRVDSLINRMNLLAAVMTVLFLLVTGLTLVSMSTVMPLAGG